MGGAALAGVGIAAVGVGVASIVMAEQFQTATSGIAANAGISQAAANKIGQAFLTTAGQTEFSASEMAGAYASVGAQLGLLNGHALSAKQALDFMRVSSDLAEGAGVSLDSATRDLGSIMQQYGIGLLGAAGASNVLFNASRLTGTSLDSVTQTFTKLHSTLGAVAPPIGEVGALMVDLAEHGETGRKALSAVNTALNGILAPTSAVKAAQTALGVTFADSNGKFIGMGGAIAELKPKLEGMSQAQQLAALKSIGFGTANKALLDTILAGPAAYDSASTAVDRLGSAHAAAAIKAQTLPVQLKTLKATGEDLAVVIGQKLIPVVEKVGQALLAAVKFFEQHKAAALALGIIVGGVLVAAMTAFTISLFTAGGALAFLMGPIGLIIIAVAAIGVAIYELASHWSQIWGEIKRIAEDAWKFLTHVWGSIFSDIKKIWGDIEGFFLKFWPYILGALMGPVGLLVAFLVEHWHTVLSDVQKVWGDVVSFFTGIPAAIMSALASFGSLILGWITDALNAVVNFIKTAWDDEVTFWGTLPGKIIDAVTGFGSLILGWITTAWNAVVSFVSSAFTAEIAFWQALPGQIISAVEGFGALILGWITDALTAVGSYITTTLAQLVAWFLALPGQILSALGDAASTLLQWGKDLLNGLWHGVTSAWDDLGDVGATVRGWIVHACQGAEKWLLDVGKDIIQGLINGITNMAGAVGNAISGVVSKVKSFITNPLGIFSPSRVFHGYGENLMQGLANGINANSHLPAEAIGRIAGKMSAPIGLGVTVGGSMGASGSAASSIGSSVAHGGVTVVLGPNSVVINAQGATADAAKTAISDGLTGMAKAIVVGIAPTRVGV